MARISRNGGWAQYMAEHGIPPDGPTPPAPDLPDRLYDLLRCWHREEYDCYDHAEILEEAAHLYDRERYDQAVYAARTLVDDIESLARCALRADVSARLLHLVEQVARGRGGDRGPAEALARLTRAHQELLAALDEMRQVLKRERGRHLGRRSG